MTSRIDESLEDLKAAAKDFVGPQVEQAQQKALDVTDAVRAFVREKPLTSVLLAGAAAYLLGRVSKPR